MIRRTRNARSTENPNGIHYEFTFRLLWRIFSPPKLPLPRERHKKGPFMHKPIIIGILGVVDDEIVTRIQNTYIKAIEKFGGSPILLPYVERDESIDAFVSLCDGFLFTGGADVDPRRYGEEIKATCGEIHEYRDDIEFRSFKKIYETKKPIMAICRGAQLVNAALGGTLYQDIPTEIIPCIPHKQTEPKDSHSHEVNVIDGTPLKALANSNRVRINSFHHQALKTLGDGIAVMATADDGVIEAVYSTKHPYLRAYQWHPERLFCADALNRAVFTDFVQACKKDN